MTDPWEVKEILDRTTGKVERIYTYKRKPCKRILLNSRLAQQLAGYTLIEKDLRSVGLWLQDIKARHTDAPSNKNHNFSRSSDREIYALIKGLFVAALTFYGKCFSRCEGRPVKLERAQLDENFRESHDDAMTYRHNFAAHSGAARLEEVAIALVFPRKLTLMEPPRIYREVMQPDLAWDDANSKEVSFIELAEHARSIAILKCRKLDEKILSEEVLPKGIKYWSKR